MAINSENLLFRHTGVKLPDSKIPIFNLGGGLKVGDNNFMGIKSHQKQKVWNLIDEFEPNKDDRLDDENDLPVDNRNNYEAARFIFHHTNEALSTNLALIESSMKFNQGSNLDRQKMSQLSLFFKEMGVQENLTESFNAKMSERYTSNPDSFASTINKMLRGVKNATGAGTTKENLELATSSILKSGANIRPKRKTVDNLAP